jgi:hypothetical protein
VPEVLSEHLLKFIQVNLETVWALEILLVMCRNEGRSWGADELNRELRGTIGLVDNVLTTFERSGLVKRDARMRYRWAPATDESSRLSQELVRVYSTHSLSVIQAITRAQTARLQGLADAFKIKKD